MMKLVTVLGLLFSFNAHASIFPGTDAREVQNGGSGLRVNGGYLTYYSAMGTFRQSVENADRVPGLDLLVREIIELPILSSFKLLTLKYFDISTERKYFSLSAKSLDPRLHQKIVDDYARLMDVSPDKVVIFAVTTPADLNTVLLPEFFQLNPNEQAAIVMHEALWLLPEADYAKVLTGEQVTQAYLEDKTSPEKFVKFVELVNDFAGDPGLKIRAGYYFDLKNQRLPADVLKSQKMLFKDFVGEKYVRATMCPDPRDLDPSGKASRDLYFESRFNYDLRAQSLLYTGLFDFLRDGGKLYFENRHASCLDNKRIEKLVQTLVVDFSTLLTSDGNYLVVYDSDGNEFGSIKYEKE